MMRATQEKNQLKGKVMSPSRPGCDIFPPKEKASCETSESNGCLLL
jgi:hypothetical protein